MIEISDLWVHADESVAKDYIGKVLSDVKVNDDEPHRVFLEFKDISNVIPGSDYRNERAERYSKELPRFISRDFFFTKSDLHGDFLVVAGLPRDMAQLKENCELREIDLIDAGNYKGVDCTIIKLMPARETVVDLHEDLESKSLPIGVHRVSIAMGDPATTNVRKLSKCFGKTLSYAKESDQFGVIELTICDQPDPPEQLMTIEEQRKFVDYAKVRDSSILIRPDDEESSFLNRFCHEVATRVSESEGQAEAPADGSTD